MEKTRIHFLRCVYCGQDGHHEQKVPKSVGTFRVKQLYNNVLILKCKKCNKVSRVATVGSILKWEDMSVEEKKAFQGEQFHDYKLNGGKTK